jgi:hypothetical protein
MEVEFGEDRVEEFCEDGRVVWAKGRTKFKGE